MILGWVVKVLAWVCQSTSESFLHLVFDVISPIMMVLLHPVYNIIQKN